MPNGQRSESGTGFVPNKIEVVNDTKRANNRLKPIVHLCEKVCRNPEWGKAPRQFQLAFKRLDRELTQADEYGKSLRKALIAFQQAYEDGVSLESPADTRGADEVGDRSLRENRFEHNQASQDRKTAIPDMENFPEKSHVQHICR